MERPPAGLEYKTAALALPDTTIGTDPAVWEGIVGVIGAPPTVGSPTRRGL